MYIVESVVGVEVWTEILVSCRFTCVFRGSLGHVHEGGVL